MTPKPTTPVVPLSDHLYAFTRYVHRAAGEDVLAAIAGSELSLSQLQLLHHLAATNARPTLKQVAQTLHITASSASKLVEDLDERRLVDRVDDDNDQRVKRVLLTPAGRERVDELAATRLDSLQRFTASLSGRERAALRDAMNIVCERPDVAALQPPAHASM